MKKFLGYLCVLLCLAVGLAIACTPGQTDTPIQSIEVQELPSQAPLLSDSIEVADTLEFSADPLHFGQTVSDPNFYVDSNSEASQLANAKEKHPKVTGLAEIFQPQFNRRLHYDISQRFTRQLPAIKQADAPYDPPGAPYLQVYPPNRSYSC